MNANFKYVGVFFLVFASCAPMATYHWEPMQGKSFAGFNSDNIYCKGYAEQFRQSVRSVNTSAGSQNPYAALGDATSNYYNALSENKRVENIYQSCMVNLGWVLVQDGPLR